ncbi:sigma 54-interacting transcriptional regulator [Desulfobacterales bacterium HSG17]|nr:sigma 54-interacting transcriptional regulator [Desulfobacterales bacterium HSG17]
MGSVETESSLNTFYENMQELVILQAGRLINNNLYTRSLLSTLPVALISTDKNSLIQVANNAAEEMLQTGLKSIKGSSLIDLFSLSPVIVEKIRHAHEQGKPVSADSLDLILADGSRKVVNIHVQMFYDEERRMFGTLLAMEDQTYIRFLRESFKQHAQTPTDGDVIANSPKMKKLVKKLDELSKNDGPVLFSGQPGSGKAFFAAKLHKTQACEPQAPFIMIDCHKIDSTRFKETLFGSDDKPHDDKHSIRFKSLHDYGTVHLAEEGTLVLLNIDALGSECLEAVYDYAAQVAAGSSALPKCRITATTKVDPTELGNRDDFFKPLLDRLLDRHIKIPALHERRKDILPLARLFLARQEGGDTKTLSKGAENSLLAMQYTHNNVKELKDAIELAVLVADGNTIQAEHIFTGPMEEASAYELDLTDFVPVKFLINDKILGRLRSAVLIGFAALICLTVFFPDHAAGVFGNYLVWGIGGPFLALLFLVLGRISCSLCPLSSAGRIAGRIWSLSKPPPEFIKKSSPFIMPVCLLIIAWSEHLFHMTTHPRATAFLLIVLLSCAVFFALLFKRETWCRYICPLGNFAGLFSLSATLFVRSNPGVCSSKCTTHNCNKGSEQYDGCPVFHHPLYARNAHICKFCFNCLKSCPHGSARLYLRPFLVRIWQQIDISENIVFFALVSIFLAPCLLASEQIPFFMGNNSFTFAILASLLSAAICRYTLPTLLFKDHKDKTLHTSRFILVMLLPAWGAFTAFQIAHIPGFETLYIITGQQNMLYSILPEHGLSLLALVQLGVIWFSALIAVAAQLGIIWQEQGKGVGIEWRNYYLVFGICLFYSLMSSWIV